MRLWDDTRGAAIQIGAVLLFALLVIALSGYQAFVVPEQNRADEFDHNKQVHGDLQDVRNAILSVASSGAPQSASVGLGTEFQNRLFFVNPPDPSGTLATEPSGEIVIENATGPETNGYWNGTTRSYNTSQLSYEPGYREYTDAPTTRYEHSFVYNHFGETTIPMGSQRLVAGDTISIPELDGGQRASHSGTASVDVVPESAGSETVQLVGDEAPIRLTIPTDEPELWAEQLEEEPRATVAEEREGAIVVELRAEDEDGEPIVYDLRASGVGIDTPETRPPAAYLVREGPENTTLGQPISVEVRDRYDNPVAGESVSVYRDGERIDETQSNRDGIARYSPDSSGEYELRIGEEAYERASFTVERWAGGEPPGDEPTDLAYRIDDLSNNDTDTGRFVASFDAGDADRVEATFDHEDGWGSRTIDHDGPRGHIRYEEGGVYGDDFQLTLRAFATDDEDEERVVETESVPVTADTENPPPDGTLRESDDPSFERVEIEDRSAGMARYDIEHYLDSESFDGRIEAVATSDGNGGYVTETSSEVADSQRLQTYGTDETFKLGVLLYDADGAVVDTWIVRDTADGTDPEI